MRKLGISIYPEQASYEKNLEYLKKAAKYGFKRIFTCFLSATRDGEKLKKEFIPFFKKAHEYGFEISVDTNNEVFEALGVKTDDIALFKDIGVDIIRLDGRFSLKEEVELTNNPYGIKIEFNGSRDGYVDELIRHGADRKNIIICHNFYPQKFTGLSKKTFDRFNKKWIESGLRNAAFISSNADETFGPWPVYDGLPTLEMHRNLPISTQARHLISCECIDDILIGNSFASDEELKELSEINLRCTTLKIDINIDLSEIENDIIFRHMHMGRDDESEYFIRCSWTRLSVKQKNIPYREYDKEKFTRGDIVIVNENQKHYQGEIEIILKDIPNDGTKNYVGHISRYEEIILEEMEKHHDHTFEFIRSAKCTE